MELQDLCGEHFLSGVDRSEIKNDDSCSDKEFWDCFNFILDGTTYSAIEDPDDGYRSCCREIMVSSANVKHTFSPCRVVCFMRPDSDGETNEIMDIFDYYTNGILLSVGTANTSDYYPYFVAEWHPENMVENAKLRQIPREEPERQEPQICVIDKTLPIMPSGVRLIRIRE